MQRRPTAARESRPLPRLDHWLATAALGAVATAGCQHATTDANMATESFPAPESGPRERWLDRVQSLFHCVPGPTVPAMVGTPGGAVAPVIPDVPPVPSVPPVPQANYENMPGQRRAIAPAPPTIEGGARMTHPDRPHPRPRTPHTP